MREFFNLVGKLIFVFFIIEIIKWVWNSGTIGKIILLSMLAFGIYQAYFNQPVMIQLN